MARRVRSPAASGLRVLGLIAGFGCLFLSGTYFLGFAYDPTTLLALLVVLMFLGLIASGIAFRIVRDPKAALRNGTVLEASGVASPGPKVAMGRTSVTVAGSTFALPSSVASQVQLGAPLTIVVAQGLRPQAAPGGRERVPRGLLLSINRSEVRGMPWVFLR